MIINVSSMGGLFGLPVSSIYISTKFALEGFSKSLSYELASQNIVVKLVEPGGGDTAFHARAGMENTGDGSIKSYARFLETTDAFFGKLTKGIAAPEKIADVIYRAATDGSRRLRFAAGEDVMHFLNARKTMSDEDHENYLRSQIG